MNKKLNKEIEDYCKLNNIEDVKKFTDKILQQGFNVEKYGMGPIEKFDTKIIEKEIEVVKEVEKIVEVPVEIEVEKIVEKEIPVEVIKEVEKIVEKEIPVEVIKEVEKIVEKEIFVTDDETVNKLQKDLDELKITYKKDLEDLTNKVETKDRINTEQSTRINQLEGEIEELKNSLKQKQEKVKELEEINKHQSQSILNRSQENQQLKKDLNFEKNKPKGDEVKILEQKVKNLEIELELEKNRNTTRKKREQPKTERQRRPGRGNIINWVSKDERNDEEDDDLWGDE